MKLYISEKHADEEGGTVQEGRMGILYANKEDVFKLAEFLNSVANDLKENDSCHMHFRDSFEEWNKEHFIDLEINTKE